MTPRQSQLLSFLRDRALAGDVTPSFEEMKIAIGSHSKAEVHQFIVHLERIGAITRDYSDRQARARAITVTGIDEYQRGYRAGFLAGQTQNKSEAA